MRNIVMFLLISLTTLSSMGEDTSIASVKLPKVTIVGSSTNTIGKIPSYITQTVRFRVKNSGEATAQILNLRPTCPCVTATAEKASLQPNEETEIVLKLDPESVHGVFKRGLWVETSDPVNRRHLLVVQGEVIPLFLNAPEPTQSILFQDAGSVWTNRFTLTASETNLFVGQPKLQFDSTSINTALTIVTNQTPTATSFDVTMVVTALKTGRYFLRLTLLPEGRTEHLRSLSFSYTLRVGTALKVVPSKVLLTPTDQPVTRKLMIQTSDKAAETNALSWTPQRQGLSVYVTPSTIKSNLRIILAITPSANAELLKAKEPKLTFQYPNHKPFDLEFVTSAAGVAGTPPDKQPAAAPAP